MRIKIANTDITRLVTACTWSGSRLNVSRTLTFTFVQDDRDAHIPVVDFNTGYTVYGYAEKEEDEIASATESAKNTEIQSITERFPGLIMNGASETTATSVAQEAASSSVSTDTAGGSTDTMTEEKEDEPIFVGNIYKVEQDRSKGTVRITCHDHLYVLGHSKTTRKFTNATPEDITKQICAELGVLPGNIVETNTPVSFIANRKTGYQIIMGAYNEAAKKLRNSETSSSDSTDADADKGPKYQPVMHGAKLDVIKKGELIKDFVADSAHNMSNSIYSESIEQIINQIMVVDKEGNQKSFVRDEDDIKKHSMFQDVYKEDPNKDTQTEAKDMLKKPERTGTIVVLGDYRVISSYSIEVRDSLQNKVSAQFWIKSDTHTFIDGKHEMKLVLEFENIMNKEKVEQEKTKKTTKTKKEAS